MPLFRATNLTTQEVTEYEAELPQEEHRGEGWWLEDVSEAPPPLPGEPVDPRGRDGARGIGDGHHQLLLAAREVLVDRIARGRTAFQQIRQSGGVHTALLHHGDRGVQQPLPRAWDAVAHFLAAFLAGAFLAGAVFPAELSWRFFTLASSLASRSDTSSDSSSSVGCSSAVNASPP